MAKKEGKKDPKDPKGRKVIPRGQIDIFNGRLLQNIKAFLKQFAPDTTVDDIIYHITYEIDDRERKFRNRPEFLKSQKEAKKQLEMYKKLYPCPECEKGYLVPVATGDKDIRVMGCKKCRYSVIVED